MGCDEVIPVPHYYDRTRGQRTPPKDLYDPGCPNGHQGIRTGGRKRTGALDALLPLLGSLFPGFSKRKSHICCVMRVLEEVQHRWPRYMRLM